jgi:AsmA protein
MMLTKRLIKLLITLALILVFAAVGLMLFVDPNRYKDLIVKKVEEQIHRPFAINGDIDWRFFPRPGLTIEGVHIGQPNNNETFAEIKEIHVYPSILPLFSKQIDVDRLSMQDAQFYLAQKINLNIASFDTALHIDMPNKYYEAQDGQLKMSVTGLDGLDHSQPINLQFDKLLADLKSDQAAIDNLKADIFGGQLFINANAQDVSKKPSLEGKITAHNLNPKQLAQTLGHDVQTTDDSVLKKLNLDATFKNTHNGFTMQPFSAQLDDTKISGDLSVKNTNALDIKFNFNVDKINFDHYLSNQKNPSATTIASPKKSTPLNLPSAQGDLTIGLMTISGLTLSQTTAHIDSHNNIVRIAPFKATSDTGTFTGSTIINMQQATPHWDIDATVNNMLLKNDKFTGNLTAQAKVTAHGSDSNSMMQTLNGNANFHVNNGTLNRIDLSYWLAVGQSLMVSAVNLKSLVVNIADAATGKTNTHQTTFKEMSGTVVIKQGIVHNDDLKVSSDTINAGGKGIIDLPKQRVDYAMHVGTTQSGSVQIPVKITGDLKNPTVGIDPVGIQKLLAQAVGMGVTSVLIGGPLVGTAAGAAVSTGETIIHDITGNNNQNTNNNNTQSAPEKLKNTLKGLLGQ